ncbi:MAG: hypothetical protein JSR73_16775 [Proteobacteria bacterium]|nr:hypothetical protein [Pseudomonadota bacterium]
MTQCFDQELRFIERKWINAGAILGVDSGSLQVSSRIAKLRMVAVAELERAPQDTDDVVVGLLAPDRAIGNFDELRILHIEKSKRSQLRAPGAVEHLAVGRERHQCHIVPRDPRCAMGEVGIEDLAAGSR